MSNFKLQISPSVTPKIFVSGFIHHSCFGIRDARVVGVTGVEPVTLRLSSACSNQLSYTPIAGGARDLKFQILNPRLEIPIGGAEETRTPDL